MDRAEADDLFARAIALQDAGDPARAEPLLRQLLEAMPDYPHASHRLGVIVGQNGDWFAARRYIEHSLLQLPDDTDALANLGWVLLNLDRFEEARAQALEVLRRQPGHMRAMMTLALSLRMLLRHAEAVAAFDAVLAADPELVEAVNQRGLSLHAAGRFDEALDAFGRVIALVPRHAEALNSRGVTLSVLGRAQEAIESFEAALAVQPRFPEAIFNLGLQMHNTGRFDKAFELYEAALALKPNYAEAHLYRAFAMQLLRKPLPEAVAALDRALACRPGYFEAINGRANLFGQMGRYMEAVADYDWALAIRPEFAEAHLNRGHALREMGRHEEAADAYREAMRRGIDSQSGLFALAALGQGEAPSTAPANYVVSLFDQYAERFDEHLVHTLKYEAHERVCEAVLAQNPSPGDVLDLGCGTGLCGPLLKPVARTLTGVDLAPRMVEVAARRGIYDRLECADIAAFLAAQPPAAYDIVVSSDVFIYVGDLEAVFAGTRSAMRPGGLFVFSTEASGGDHYELLMSRRYAHSPAYVEQLAARHDFDLIAMTKISVRLEAGAYLPGHVTVLRAR